jgi:peptidoglycan/LPS O-acetylase OafA/YrhL
LLIGYSLAGFNIIDGGVSLSGFLYQVFYLANYQQIFSWSGDTPYGLGVLWSLAVEEHFYLVFPTLFLLIRRYAGVKPTVVFIMTLCIVVLCWRIHLVSNLEVIASRTYYATDTRIDSILWGCLLALTVNPCFTTKQPELNVKALFLIGLGVVVILLSLVYRNPEFRETYRYTIQGVALIPLFYYAVAMSESRLFKCLNWNVIKKLGVYSYSMYLIHFVVIGLIRKHELMDSKLLVLLCTLSVSVGFAALID